MAKRVNADSDFQAIENEVNEVKTKLSSIKSTYSGDLSTILSNCQNVIGSLGSWQDDVSTKLQQSLENNVSNGAVPAIENDLNGGGFQQLYKTLDQLYINLASASYSKIKYNNASRSRSKLAEDDPHRPSQDTVNA